MPKIDKKPICTNIVEAVLFYKKNVTWSQPWKVSMPVNFITGEHYKDLICLSDSKYWVTEEQLQELGGKPKEGKLGNYRKSIKMFNLADCVGVKIPKLAAPKKYSNCAKIVSDYLDQSSIELQLDFTATFYNRAFDLIRIPSMDCFSSPELYYASIYHELVHSTAHKRRLNRFKSKLPKFGTREYEEEELVAELGSCILCAYMNISFNTFEHQLSYIANILRNILQDGRIKNKEVYKKKIVEKSMIQAQIAVDYILSVK